MSRVCVQNSRLAARVLLLGLALVFAVQPYSLLACAACYGQSDSAMAKGMNWGIFTLLAVIVSVLGGIAGFFVFLARRSANGSDPALQTTH
jgi:hypothetical protein